MGARCGNDDCPYEPDAINVGLLLFPAKVCTVCGAELPGNHDYFVPNAKAPDHLTTACRRCRRASAKRNYNALPLEVRQARARQGAERKRRRVEAVAS